MRVAAIDVGTNTVRMLAVEFDEELVHVLEEAGGVTRLGAGLIDTGRIDPEDAKKTLAMLEHCLARARELSIELVDVVGTEVFRAADNGRDVAAEFSTKTGHALRILSPDGEAEAAYLGVVGWQDVSDPTPVLVIDVGGGSTQVIGGEGIALLRSRSIPAGSLRLSEAHLKHDPPKPAEIEAARKAAARQVKALAAVLPPKLKGLRAVGVGGTVCAIGAWVHEIVPFDPGRLNGVHITLSKLENAVAEWSRLSLRERMEKGGMSEGRARVVPGGAILLEAVLKSLSLKGIEVSTRGIRHGLVLRRVLMV